MSPVNLETRDNVAVITVDNPPVNALSQAVRAGLVDCIDKAENDTGVNAIVLQCAGRTFIAGADITEFNKPPMEPHLPDVITRIEACDKPVVAAIHGTALGGGLETAMGCHYRVAHRSASVGLPEVTLGVLPGASGTQRLPRLAGVERALDIMTSGKPVKAPAALDDGIVDAIAQGDDLLDRACVFAAEKATSGEAPRRISDLEVAAPEAGFFDAYREKIARKIRGLSAPERIIRCVEAATNTPFFEALKTERELFLECKASPQSAALRHAFFAERAAAKVPGVGKNVQPRQVDKLAVIGAGTMGAGIAYAALTTGLEVTLLDNSEAGLENGANTIRGLYEGGVKRGRIDEAAMQAGLARLTTSQDYAALADVDMVIEAVFENLSIKQQVFTALDKVCKPGAVLATNTSTLDVDAVAGATGRPQDVIGMHFFSPAHIMRLLEIVRANQTSAEVIATALAIGKRLRKVSVVVGNCFGFVGNRMLYSYGREAHLLLLEGAAPEFVDQTLYNWGMAMGPHAVGDLAGLDIGYKVRQERTDLPDDPRFYRMADVLAEMGRLGQKTGKGMYLYEDGSRQPKPDPEVQELIRNEAARLGIEQREISTEEIVERCIYGLVIEGARILEEGIAARSGDIDTIWINGYGFPRHRGGPMHYADHVGLDRVYETLTEFESRFGSMYWTVPDIVKDLAERGKGFADYAG